METFIHQLLEIGFLKLTIAMTADESAAEDIDHANCAIVNLFGRVEIKIELEGVTLGILVGLHILPEGRHAHEDNR